MKIEHPRTYHYLEGNRKVAFKVGTCINEKEANKESDKVFISNIESEGSERRIFVKKRSNETLWKRIVITKDNTHVNEYNYKSVLNE